MLDTDHPQAQYIFAASALEDALLARAVQMADLQQSERGLQLAECLSFLGKMHRLNRDAFKNAPYLTSAIAEAQAALESLAQAEGAGAFESFLRAKAKLEGPQGFGTCFI